MLNDVDETKAFKEWRKEKIKQSKERYDNKDYKEYRLQKKTSKK